MALLQPRESYTRRIMERTSRCNIVLGACGVIIALFGVWITKEILASKQWRYFGLSAGTGILPCYEERSFRPMKRDDELPIPSLPSQVRPVCFIYDLEFQRTMAENS